MSLFVSDGCRRLRLARVCAAGLFALMLIAFPSLPERRVHAQAKTEPALPKERNCRLLLFAPKGDDAHAVVFLDRVQEGPDDLGKNDLRILTREILRQAVLLAVREELGQGTRDGTLWEPPLGEKAKKHLQIGYSSLARKRVIFRIRDEQDKVLVEQEWKMPAEERSDYLALVQWVEKLSRQEIPEALKEAGVPGKGNAVRASSAIPPEAEQALPRMHFLAQATALRALHGDMRKQGESPQRLAALVRAYANLGVLTEFHWNASNKAYKARALLYAQRLLARAPQSPWGRWHRAYALALTGMHGEALRDLDEAEKLWTNRKEDGSGRPPWVDVLNAYCRFDTKRLKALADKGQKELALLLHALSVEWWDSTALILQNIRAAVKEMPECFRILDAMGDYGGVSNLHVATRQGFEVFTKTIPDRLRKMPGFPTSVARLLNTEEPEATVYRKLVEEGLADAGEPSWSSVGRMLQEVRFRQVQRRAHFLRYDYAVPTEEYVHSVLPLVAGHPFELLIRMYDQSGPQRRKTCQKLMSEMPQSELELPQHLELAFEIERSGKGMSRVCYPAMQVHADDVYRDQAALLSRLRDRSTFAHRLLEISPHAPLAVAALIAADWSFAQPRLEEWQKTQSQHAVVQEALGKRYLQLGKLDEAERYLRRYLEMSPDRSAYRTLARVYKQAGKIDKWKEVLDAFLKQEDHGLEHAQVRVEIAQYFMSRKEWDKARPYADAAAQTYAEWAMLCAADCYEGLEDWDKAELWTRRASERYDDGRLEWFFWCKRTGKGDLEAAQRLAADHVHVALQRATEKELFDAAFFYLLTDKKQETLDVFQRIKRMQPTDSTVVYVALAADNAGRRDVRDSAWEELSKKKHSFGQLAQLMRDTLAQGENAVPDAKKLEELLKKMPARPQSDAHWFMGWFLILRDRPREAAEHLRACLRMGASPKAVNTVATVQLRELKLEP